MSACPVSGPVADHHTPKHELDRVDRTIIERLQRDGRTPFGSVAAQLGIGQDEVRTRVDTMLAGGVIDIVAVTDPLQLGYPRQAMLGVITDGPARPVGEAIAQIDEVIYQELVKETYNYGAGADHD